MNGAIALIPKGEECEYAEKSYLTAEAGGVAAVVYNPESQDYLYGGWLGEEATIPTVMILYGDAAEILEAIKGPRG